MSQSFLTSLFPPFWPIDVVLVDEEPGSWAGLEVPYFYQKVTCLYGVRIAHPLLGDNRSYFLASK